MPLRIKCECGRELGSKVFKQHARKCASMLRKWRSEGHPMYLLDERSEAEKLRDPIPDFPTT